MKKNIKYSVSLIVMVLSIMFGYIVYAEENDNSSVTTTNNNKEQIACTLDAQRRCPDGSVGRIGPNCEFICSGDQNSNINISDKSKSKINNIWESLTTRSREEKATLLSQTIKSIKASREEFKAKLEIGKEQAKLKIAEMKTNFKESLNKIKDENKKISAEKIVDTIQWLNTKTTDNFSNKINQIENVLVSIESRITKAESKGLDVSSVKIEVGKAEVAIVLARESILTQAKKVYEVNITDEASLKAEMKKLRDIFSKDIKAVHAIVKSAHEAVRDTATTLAKIPKIDEVEVTNKVEDNNTNNNN